MPYTRPTLRVVILTLLMTTVTAVGLFQAKSFALAAQPTPFTISL